MSNVNSLTANTVAEPGKKSNKRLILEAIKRYPGKTALWIADYLGIPINKISGRFGEMRDAGLIRSIGDTLIGKTPHAQWVIIEAKKEVKQAVKQLSIF